MTSSNISNMYLLLLLMGTALASVNGKGKAVGPGALVKKLALSFPEIDPYAELQVKLEDIADASNLYNASDSSKNSILMSLYQTQEVQNITNECEKFHVQVTCKYSLYRSINGTCNNMKYPKWGSAATEQDRYLPANYIGSHGFRKTENGTDLPPARVIVLKLKKKDNPSKTVSALFTYYGQLITHDIMLTPLMTENGKVKFCCDDSKEKIRSCAPIYYPKDDPFYSKFNVTCQVFTRAIPFPKCNFEKRGPVNKKTAFIDLSNVYGSSEKEAMPLRSNDGTGEMKMQDGDLLPKNHDEYTTYCPTKSVEKCFEGGDDRVNQHTMLVSLQTIFVRMHNKMAKHLLLINPQWDDEKTYQESRRIVTAVNQIIVYREYLPYLIGNESMHNFDLNLDFNNGSLYDEEVNPSMLAEFTTAAFRIHSMVPTNISKLKPLFKFRNSYSNFRPIHTMQLGLLVYGSCEVASQRNDPSFVEDVYDYLFKVPGADYGTDLVSIDIQRGRDVGLPTYVDIVKRCTSGAVVILDFMDLSRYALMTDESVKELQAIYDDVRDIELYIGMIFEKPLQDLDVGPTVVCISIKQFYRQKFGDSFFVTHKNGRYPFTKEQLDTLKESSLAQVLCHNGDVESIRKYPLLLPSRQNPVVSCAEFSRLDLGAWREEGDESNSFLDDIWIGIHHIFSIFSIF